MAALVQEGEGRNSDEFVVSLLDYGAGNVRSLRNAIKHLGYAIKDIESAEDIANAEVIVFPGQGCFRQAMQSLRDKGMVKPLQDYLKADRPFFGICLGMQLLFESSEESPGEVGLSIIPGAITRFDTSTAAEKVTVPQIGWNGMSKFKESTLLENIKDDDKVYFVHSFCALPTKENLEWVLTTTDYGNQKYVSMVQKGNVCAAQAHPEKSGAVGLELIRAFLASRGKLKSSASDLTLDRLLALPRTILARRVIACLDVRSNDQGDLVVTKGDQYDVREHDNSGKGGVRNLGKPVALCKRYFDEGADEVVFLNITSFRQGVLNDLPMLQVLQSSSQNVFVPLTVGGGIREYTDTETGKSYSALQVAGEYFRAGADKVSIGSDAVYSVEEFLRTREKTGKTSIEQISNHYGAQAVVVSIDPKRVYVHSPDEIQYSPEVDILGRKTICALRENESGPNGEKYCWWQVTVKGGRETRDLDAVQVARVCEIFGAGEIMLNCIDMDGQCQGYDIPLIRAVQSAVSIPVIASSGAGKAQHFVEVFQETSVNAALAAGMFHRNEVSIAEVKTAIDSSNIPVRFR